MKVVARHRNAPLVALDDGSIIDTEDLEVVGTGFVATAGWELNPTMETDPRWEEIARADSSSLGVTERRIANGPRTYRAPSHVRTALTDSGVDTPLVEGEGLTLDELGALCEQDEVTGPAEDWMFALLNKHEDNPDETDEAELFSLAEPELNFDEIDAAGDEPSPAREDPEDITAAVEPPPGQFSKVVYLALIEEDDAKSVQDLVALVASAAGAADAFVYGDKGWEESQETLATLQGAAPPPIKQLEDWQTESIIAQINSTGDLSDQAKAEPWAEPSPDGTVHAQPENPDGPQTTVKASAFDLDEAGILWGPDNKRILSVVMGAGGADRNRGNAETLRRYWTVGKGGAKIRWNTPGDWTRCRRHLSKYLGARAAGYCQLRHHEMTGMWTGDRAHRALRAGGDTEFAGSNRATSGGNSKEARSQRAYARQPAGSGSGGQFAPGKARDAAAEKSQKDPAARKLYNDILSASLDDAKKQVKTLSDAQLVALTRIMYSSKTSDKDIVDRRLAIAAEMAQRGYDVKDFGARGGGINSDKGKGQFDEALSQTHTSPDKTPIAPAPRKHNSATLVSEYEDGSAKYSDGTTWDPEKQKFRRPKKTAPQVTPEPAGGRQGPALLANWPSDWAPKPPAYNSTGSPVVHAYEDGSAKYADGLTYDPNTSSFRAPRGP